MRVKICGITRVDDALAAARAGADFVGLILAPSVRRVSPQQAAQIAQALPAAGPRPVLVFRDAPLDEILHASTLSGVSAIQLHGDESADLIAAVRARVPGAFVIRAVSIVTRAPVADGGVAAACGAADVVLLDAPKGGPRPEASEFDRACVAIRPDVRGVWRAGGLTVDNVAEVVGGSRYDGVDVAGGVEAAPGVKDHALIERFVRAAKRGGGA